MRPARVDLRILITELDGNPLSGFPHRDFFQACEDCGLAFPLGWFLPELKSDWACKAISGDASAVQHLTVQELRYFVKWLCFGQKRIEEGWPELCRKRLPQAVVERLIHDHGGLPYEPA